MEFKFQLCSTIGNFEFFEPISFEVCYEIYRIMTAPPFISSQLSLYIRALEV